MDVLEGTKDEHIRYARSAPKAEDVIKLQSLDTVRCVLGLWNYVSCILLCQSSLLSIENRDNKALISSSTVDLLHQYSTQTSF